MIYAVTVYCYLDPKLGLVVRKYLALLGMECLEARWSSSSKSISEVKGYSDWNYNGFSFSLWSFALLCYLVMLGLSGPEDSYTGVVMLGRNILVLCLFWSYCGQEYSGCAQALR